MRKNNAPLWLVLANLDSILKTVFKNNYEDDLPGSLTFTKRVLNELCYFTHCTSDKLVRSCRLLPNPNATTTDKVDEHADARSVPSWRRREINR